MGSPAKATPGFGQADLSNCEREQIHLAGSIQPHGALLLVREPELTVVQASVNAAAFLGAGGAVVGRKLAHLAPDLAEQLAARPLAHIDVYPAALRCRLGWPTRDMDCLLHRPLGGGLVIELEEAAAARDVAAALGPALEAVLAASSLRNLCDETARLFKHLTGYDRVMVYRFDDEGHGEVFSEEREAKLEAYLGNRYPASDIPQIARQLYIRNRVRVLVDVGYAPVALEPRRSPISGDDLDMSLCFLRSMSPIHIQYLQNMGVAATLVTSLVVGGKLWGLIACHHYVKRVLPFEDRALCEVLAEAVSTRIAALESVLQAQAELWVRRLEQRMIDSISRHGDWRMALFDGTEALLQPVRASGAALLFEDHVMTSGDVPGTQDLRAIGAWLDGRTRQAGHAHQDGPTRRSVTAVASLGISEPRFAKLTPVASGLLAVPVSSIPGEYLVWFRPERVHTVTWGGDPTKPMVIGSSPADLSPRRSFAQWHQLVEGTSDPWVPGDMAAARLIGDSITDVVLQFRSLRMVIAEDQLETVREQVQMSDQPVLIANAAGRVLSVNPALTRLVGAPGRGLRRVDDLPAMFANAADLKHRLQDMMKRGRSWRGEARLGDGRLLLVRADPVFSGPDRVLGFVLLFTDLTEQKAAEAARRQFQLSVLETHRINPGLLDSSADLLYRNLLTTLVENAQLAALEITDGTDMAQIPRMLETLKTSVSRAAHMLERLIRHASDS